MNIQRVGIHTNDGALQPQGTLAYPRPLGKHTGTGRVWIPMAWYPSPMAGIFIQGAPRYSTFGREIWNQKSAGLEHCMGGERRGPGAMGGELRARKQRPTKSTAPARTRGKSSD